ncbi:squalene/phytoene synthase family protein [Devosia sp. XJ19-1]|uniref:Squalene/phytoene synthase family protein n=1 Tax=Devosia ureilytica TaxID=2952754 RepID=A0A9Q4ALD3_9HYPH|nr:phytoene/squalene synthase family protein [Devosia ureilytica]MCP8882140.1 squalene/phytoene synthase family protein [Devosia ureilytica]MCP8885974.1 squalene/phytoene synthase family protein [Devosia ureilytica]
MAGESLDFAAKALRENDRDRYLATLVLPAAARPGIAALYAFNADIAAIRERVSGPQPGEIRLQWWNDALTGNGHGAVRQNPLADALLDTVERYGLPIGTLQRLIGARRFDLYDDPMPDLGTFEGYAGETASTLFQLSAMILNDGAPVEPGDAAGHLGVAQAMIGHLRAFGRISAQGRIMLPWSILEANGVTEGEIFAGQQSEGLHAALSQVAELAVGHLSKARAAIAQLPATLRPAFAAIVLLETQLKSWQNNSNVFAVPADDADWRKIARLAWWSLKNR